MPSKLLPAADMLTMKRLKPFLLSLLLIGALYFLYTQIVVMVLPLVAN
ncbi:MAG TPA: hypothetical protein VK528_04845 [Flavobacterium sp.]|nr:hypothetical protein [Flavobacterium sp.]